MKITEVTEQIEAVHDDLTGSSFIDVNLASATFSNVNLACADFESACLNDVKLHNVTCLRMQIYDADLSGVTIAESNTETMTIDGITVAALMAAYRKCGPNPTPPGE
ncbi:pentapeptide repeat-containing protein [Granulicella tundricola]|uniref:Pentapeptide repeat protein n=1 Tax=Granulicella tundricola (strain ATCC BAA-1859 / DSM 23138 / MP5ACTX9) TaxID=1198114 RepID=E8X1L3_GRATM|nr:pentapeptide repeat-containing protein [Granulicella tundricola]ADW70248.1 pentapeptide repeat protein [Granulicella tundricola MP5ACTX9]